MLALVALSGHGQTTDTLSIGMEMKLQNVISTNVFMMHKETTPMKGLPADTASFHLYEMSGILCALGKTDKESTYFVSLDLNGDKDFTNDYRYSFTLLFTDRKGTKCFWKDDALFRISLTFSFGDYLDIPYFHSRPHEKLLQLLASNPDHAADPSSPRWWSAPDGRRGARSPWGRLLPAGRKNVG